MGLRSQSRNLRRLGHSRSAQAAPVIRFCLADGRAIERQAGFAIIHTRGAQTGDDVVFAEPGDLTLFGARTLEGLNFRIDPVRHELVDAGPVDAAAGGISARGQLVTTTG